MRDAPAVGMVERLGEPGEDPGDRLRVGEPSEDLSGRPGHVGRGILGGRDPVEPREEVGPRPRPPAGRRRDRAEGRPAQEGHADDLERAAIDVGMMQDLDDMGVPCPGEPRGLGRGPGRRLEDDRARGEVGLLGEEDPRERASAQLADERVRADLVADFGEVRGGGGVPAVGRAERSEREEHGERLAVPRESAEEVLGARGEAGRLGEAELVIDQLDRLAGPVGADPGDPVLGAGRPPGPPGLGEGGERRLDGRAARVGSGDPRCHRHPRASIRSRIESMTRRTAFSFIPSSRAISS